MSTQRDVNCATRSGLVPGPVRRPHAPLVRAYQLKRWFALPTQRLGDDPVLLTDEVVLDDDDNSGGGSEAGLDASTTYVLDLTGIEPHPQQGVHVKLTINAQGSQGADVKHKVFWVTDCGYPSPY